MIVLLSKGWDHQTIEESTTGMPQYDLILRNPEYFKYVHNLVGEVVMMTPDEYISCCCEVFDDYPFDELVTSRTDETLSQVTSAMSLGVKFDLPVVNYAKMSQNGLHRAMASKELGIDRIPVLVINWWKPKSQFVPSKVVEHTYRDVHQLVADTLGKSYYKYQEE